MGRQPRVVPNTMGLPWGVNLSIPRISPSRTKTKPSELGRAARAKCQDRNEVLSITYTWCPPEQCLGVRGRTSSTAQGGQWASAGSPLMPSVVHRSPAIPWHRTPRGAGGLAPLHHLQPERTLPGPEPGAGGGALGAEGGSGAAGPWSGAGCFSDLQGV